ncbi:hypothetical protein F5B22DRAFT_660668 [Xylaria bambusicola]|uniref:uncharacterized protein n=1 Tax=Xylaria bambusicola TaxID=326684 RepID=UPI0020088142|nr:uncharacterized protein F5B22DRAFT_660668 [Xylaria bambusicola]KAI0506159.1 hypothetical protein F5B22DRAFT_660668 [Xylaria bambusicola]
MGLTINQISACGRELFVVDIVFTVVTIGFLLMRFWSARISRRKLYPDDIFVIFAFVAKSVLTGAAFWGTFNGLGKHIYLLNLQQLTVQVKLLLISEFTYTLGTAAIKLSMLCLYHRIYTTPTFRRWNYFVMALVVAYIITFLPLLLTNCVPLSQYWDPKPGGWCRDTLIYDMATVAANFFLDLAVLILPMPVLWSLKMSIRDKLTVTAMFSIGFVTIALISWRSAVTVRTRGSPDWTGSLCKVGEIATLELYLGIIAVCIPTLGPLFNAYMKPVFSKLGLTTMGAPKSGPNNLYLRTWGSSGTKKRVQNYSELNESADRIVSRDNSIRLGTTGESKVVSECTFKPKHETLLQSHSQDGIHVQRDIESQYHPKKTQYFE